MLLGHTRVGNDVWGQNKAACSKWAHLVEMRPSSCLLGGVELGLNFLKNFKCLYSKFELRRTKMKFQNFEILGSKKISKIRV